MDKILLCGVGLSENLGDRIIAETINTLLESRKENISITNFDFTTGLVKEDILITKKQPIIHLNSTTFLKKITPDHLRRLKTKTKYNKNIKLKKELEENIIKNDTIIIGGGHLLIDNYLNFPIGIENITSLAAKYNKPVYFMFVGAKGPWSTYAKKKFLTSLEYSQKIAVRDEFSKEFLISMDETLNNKVIVLSDPALFTNDLMKTNNIKKSEVKKIGVGIMDPQEIIRHSDLRWTRTECATWWVNIISELAELGFEVDIFTNGAKTDNGFVEYFIKNKVNQINNVNLLNYPTEYKELLSIINSQDLVIAQRLHACLPAISFTKPTFGVIWDVKLKSIFTDLGLHDYVIDFSADNSATLNSIVNKDHTKIFDNYFSVINIKREEMIRFVDEFILGKN